MEKARAELALFSSEKVHLLHLMSFFIVCTLIDYSYEPISVPEFLHTVKCCITICITGSNDAKKSY